MANALGLGAVSFGARAVPITTNVMKNPQRTHVATTGGVAHSSWLGVLLHLDDDFLHRLRYNCVERGGAFFPAARTQLFERVREGFTSFHGQRVVLSIDLNFGHGPIVRRNFVQTKAITCTYTCIGVFLRAWKVRAHSSIQRTVRQARWLPFATTLNLTVSFILAVAVRSINTPPPLFFSFFFGICPKTYAGGGRVK